MQAWGKLANEIGMPWMGMFLVILLATGVIPSPLYSKVELLDQHRKAFDVHLEQSREVVPLLRSICRSVAKTETGRAGCDRSFPRED